jgi:hypothetical protein
LEVPVARRFSTLHQPVLERHVSRLFSWNKSGTEFFVP